jgi:hypothetical protein
LAVAYGTYANLAAQSDALEQEAANRSSEYRQNAKNRIERVCATALSKPDCVAEAYQSAREQERMEQDLAAQKVTAWWTKVMGLAALIGMALSAIGVWLVKTTFDETRKANEITKTQQRARIDIEIKLSKNSNPTIIDAIITAKNIGFSPAIGAIITVSADRITPSFSNFEGIPGFAYNIASGTAAQMAVLFVKAELAIGHEIYGMVKYQSIFGEVHTTYFCERIRQSDLTESGLVTMEVKPSDWPADT